MTGRLSVRELHKIFRSGRHNSELVAVDGLSFDVQAGESLAIVGESGSGKTTVARMITGLEEPTSGTILLDGRPRPKPPWPRRERKPLARQVQLVFQDPFLSLDPCQTVASALDEVLGQHFDLDRPARRRRVSELLERVGLDERHAARRPRSLSGGERQRVAIARALAVQPDVLVLDEAVSALDVSVQAQVLNLLSDLRTQLGLTYLFISHDLGVVRQVSDNCIVMHRGRVVEAGSTASVLDAPRDPYTQRLLAAVPRPGWRPERAVSARLGA